MSAARARLALDDRVAIVTGAGSATGIGLATATVLAELGARVTISATTARIADRAAELAGAGLGVEHLVADLTRPADARVLAATVERREGRIDVLVNCAGMVQTGVPSSHRPFAELDESDWHRDIALNLTTAFNTCRAVVPGMIARRGGRIVNVSSVTGTVVSIPGSVGYGAAKAAMDGLTRGLALELGPHGITVNSVAPGWIATGSSSPDELEAGRHTPVGRPGTPVEVADVIAFLAGGGSGYLTGQSLVVDGGNTIQEHKGR